MQDLLVHKADEKVCSAVIVQLPHALESLKLVRVGTILSLLRESQLVTFSDYIRDAVTSQPGVYQQYAAGVMTAAAQRQ